MAPELRTLLLERSDPDGAGAVLANEIADGDAVYAPTGAGSGREDFGASLTARSRLDQEVRVGRLTRSKRHGAFRNTCE
jgi:hypothetical protein